MTKRCVKNIVASVWICISGISCTEPENTWLKLFTFPPGSKVHESNWDYIGSIYFYHRGRWSDPSDVRGDIEIKDRQDAKLLNDSFNIYGESVEPEIHWDVFDTITILLYNYEAGKPVKVFVDSTGDSTYTNYLMRLDYCFDSTQSVFERCDVN